MNRSAGKGAPVQPVDFSTGNVVINIENLWKEYRLGVISHDTLVADLQSWWARVRGREDPNRQIEQVIQDRTESISGVLADRFWALRDISFNVHQGDAFGLIGGNGAGKSTLLKILSRVTIPTKGRINVKGRIASLLEVGTGFHPELTGRENIFLNGAIMGMNKGEIRKRLDEIISFAEVEKFIDTPVKRYSSGMYVRLAFSVAAHLEPEILVVDEVLAVGDAQFQRKCINKMADVGKEGTTVIFVSHNMNTIQRLCGQGVLLKSGALANIGGIQDVISDYLRGASGDEENTVWEAPDDSYIDRNAGFSPLRLSLVDAAGGAVKSVISRRQDVFVKLEFAMLKEQPDLTAGFSLFDSGQNQLFVSLFTDVLEENRPKITLGRNVLLCRLPMEILNEGAHMVVLEASLYMRDWIFNPMQTQEIHVSFEISGGLSDSAFWQNRRGGVIAPQLVWSQQDV